MRIFGLGSVKKTFEFRCKCCGEIHRGSPSVGYKHPIQYFWVPEEDRQTRIKDNDDFCIIEHGKEPGEDTDYFIRGVLEVPIHGVEDPFLWGIWISQSKTSFEKYLETFSSDQTGSVSFGWLTVTMPYYNRCESGEELEDLKCDVEWGASRPKVLVWECDHPLFQDQQNGISWETAVEIAQLVIHGTGT